MDEDDCIDTEEAAPQARAPPPPEVAFESSANASSEISPVAEGGQKELFEGLKTEEKMVLFATMWNCSRCSCLMPRPCTPP